VSPAISHLHRDWARPLPTSAPGLGSAPAHICTGTGLAPAHIYTGTGLSPCPHLHRDAAILVTSAPGLGSAPAHSCPETGYLLDYLLCAESAPYPAQPLGARGVSGPARVFNCLGMSGPASFQLPWSVRPSASFQLLGSVRPSANFHLLADSAVPTPLRAWRLSTARSQAAPTATCCGASVHSTDEQHAMGTTAHCVHRRTNASRKPKHTGDSRLGAAVLRAQSSLA
jgi:hypothetical protein